MRIRVIEVPSEYKAVWIKQYKGNKVYKVSLWSWDYVRSLSKTN